VERTGSSATVNEIVMTANNVNGNSTTGNAAVTPLRQHRLSSIHQKPHPILSRRATSAPKMCGGRDGSRRRATSVKLWLFKGMVQVSRREVAVKIHMFQLRMLLRNGRYIPTVYQL
jgi:hypothetical protein